MRDYHCRYLKDIQCGLSKNSQKCSLNYILNFNESAHKHTTLNYRVNTREHIEIIDTYIDIFGAYRYIVHNNSVSSDTTICLRVFTPILKKANKISARIGRVVWTNTISNCEQKQSGDFTIIKINIDIGYSGSNFTYTQSYKFTIDDDYGNQIAESYPIKFNKPNSPIVKHLCFRK